MKRVLMLGFNAGWRGGVEKGVHDQHDFGGGIGSAGSGRGALCGLRRHGNVSQTPQPGDLAAVSGLPGGPGRRDLCAMTEHVPAQAFYGPLKIARHTETNSF